MFDIENNDIAIAILNVHYKFPSWSVEMQPFDLVLKAFGNITRIQYFLEKPFLISFVVRNYPIGPEVVLRIDNILAGERRVVPANYRCIEDEEYTTFGQQFDNDRSEIDFGNGIGADL